MEIAIPDLTALAAFAREFAQGLAPGSAVAFQGALGAGKTTFIRALLLAMHGSDDAASSPTFIFRQRYDGKPPIEHLDLYRIENVAELAELGLEDAFGPDRVTFVEWPERAPELLPHNTLEVSIAGSGDGPRTITIAKR